MLHVPSNGTEAVTDAMPLQLGCQPCTHTDGVVLDSGWHMPSLSSKPGTHTWHTLGDEQLPQWGKLHVTGEYGPVGEAAPDGIPLTAGDKPADDMPLVEYELVPEDMPLVEYELVPDDMPLVEYGLVPDDMPLVEYEPDHIPLLEYEPVEDEPEDTPLVAYEPVGDGEPLVEPVLDCVPQPNDINTE